MLKVINRLPSLQPGIEGKKAAASFHKELHEAGMPDKTALRLTEDYVSIFTDRTQEVTKQSLASRMLHKAKHELAGEEEGTKKGLGDRFSNLKGKTREGFQFLRRQVLLTKFVLRRGTKRYLSPYQGS